MMGRRSSDPLAWFLLSILAMVPLVLWELRWSVDGETAFAELAGGFGPPPVKLARRPPPPLPSPPVAVGDPDDDEAEEEEETPEPKPYLILHMGPDKTGTTAIQSFLRDHRDALESDGYDPTFSKGTTVKEHRRILAFLLQCFTDQTSKKSCHKKDPEGWDLKVAAFWEPRVLGGTNTTNNTTNTTTTIPHVIWSTEGFRWTIFRESSDWKAFLGAVRERFEVRVVLVYRRYFDWMISRYHEDHRSSEYSGGAFSLWPGESGGGKGIPTLEAFLEHERNGTCPFGKGKDCAHSFSNRLLRHENGTIRDVVHPIISMTDQLAEQNVTVELLSFHELDPREGIACHALPHAPHSCDRARRLVAAPPPQQPPKRRKRRKHKEDARPSDQMAIQHDRVALEAHALGLVPPGMHRGTVKHTIRLYLEEHHYSSGNGTDPLGWWVCPDPGLLRWMEDTSAAFEASVRSREGRRGPWGTDAHAEAFAEALRTRRFCHLHTTRLLEDEGLLAVLRSSNATTS